MNKLYTLIFVVASSAGSSFGQVPHGIPECKGHDAVNYILLKDSERSFYFENTTVTDDYLLVGLSLRYLKLAEELKRAPLAVTVDAPKNINSITKTHVIQESKNRLSRIFSIDGNDAILTRWNLQKDGAKISHTQRICQRII